MLIRKFISKCTYWETPKLNFTSMNATGFVQNMRIKLKIIDNNYKTRLITQQQSM